MSRTRDNRILLIALAADIGIAVSKFAAAAITGSSAMLTEGVHSVVDSLNQILLMWGRRQARKPPDGHHPFGYGRELFFWSFIVAVLVFALGAGVSIYEGVLHILHPRPAVSPLLNYAVLAVAFLLEGTSALAALRAFRAANAGLGWIEAIQRSKDPPAFIVLLEDGAAMAGIIAAAIGIFLAHLTHEPFFDGAASVVIGLILAATAFVLAVKCKALLIGESADPRLIAGIRAAALSQGGVCSVGEILTSHLAPDQITAVLSADFDDHITAGDVERIIAAIEAEVERDWPAVKRLYIRPQLGAGRGSPDAPAQ